MKKIKEFNNEQIKHIKSIFPTNCEHMDRYSGKEKCPVCKKWFRRLPDLETFKKLFSLYDATDLAWSKVFYTDRASVTNLRKKYKLGTYNLGDIWTENRYFQETENFLDTQPIFEFFNLMNKYTETEEKVLLKISQINKNYLDLVLKFNEEIKNEYLLIKQFRNRKNIDIEYIFCIRCQIKKKKHNFKYIEGSQNLFSKICNICAEENISKLRSSEIEVKIKCQKCGEMFHKNNVEENNSEQSICSNCKILISESKMKSK